MDSDDLSVLWDAATAALAWDDFRTLLRLGVPAGTLANRRDFQIGADDVAVTDGRWRREFQGRRAAIVPVWGSEGLCDLVAFDPRAPKAVWLARGADGPLVLGGAVLDLAAYDHEPLTVFETPLDWLRADCGGIVILRPGAFWPFHLEGIPELRTTSREFGLRLHSLIERPFQTPDVRFPA